MWAPEDDYEPPKRLLGKGMCPCDMCDEDPAEETELEIEDIE